MGRKLRRRRDDDQAQAEYYKDDRRQAEKLQPKQLDLFLDRNGAVADAILTEGGYDKPITSYTATGQRIVNKKNTQQAVKDLRSEITSARFMSQQDLEKTITSTSIKQGKRELTDKEKLNLAKREYQVRAIALLTAARVGEVDISSYDKGILNQLARGKYEDVVYGKKQSNGRRRYERGTFRNQLGLDRGSIRSRDPAAQARAKEKADQLLRRGRYADRIA